MERRRRWAASGRLPLGLAARFTLAEQAVLAVVAAEVAERGDCRLPLGRLAAVAGVGETSARRALRAARDMGVLTVEERRVSMWRNLPNVVGIVSAQWTAWLRLGRAGGGRQSAQGTNTQGSRKATKRRGEGFKKLLGEERGPSSGGIPEQNRGLGTAPESQGQFLEVRNSLTSVLKV